MRWERRKPLWPIVAGLLCLFLSAVSAPFCWKHPVLNVHALFEQRLQEVNGSQSDIAAPAACFFEVEAPTWKQESQPLPNRVPATLDTIMCFCDTFTHLIHVSSDCAATPATRSNLSPADGARLIDDILGSDLPPEAPAAHEEHVELPADDMPAAPIVKVEQPTDRLAMLIKEDRRPISPQDNVAQVAEPPATEMEGGEATEFEAQPGADQAKPVLGADSYQAQEPASPTEHSLSTGPVADGPPTDQELMQEDFGTEGDSFETGEFGSPGVSSPLIPQRAVRLFRQLESLSQVPVSQKWAAESLGLVRRLTVDTSVPREAGRDAILQLTRLAETGCLQAMNIRDPAIQQNWLQAAKALERRMPLWEELLSCETPDDASLLGAAVGSSLMPALSDVANLLGDTANGEQWREYLLLDELMLATSEGTGADSAHRIRLAQDVLARMTDDRLTLEQRLFIASGPLARLMDGLRGWAAGPVDLNVLLALIERYESDGQLLYAKAIAQLEQRMLWSTDPRLLSLAKDLQQQYHGANMRIAISERMLNRMVPGQKTISAPVRERIADRKVRGRSRTTTEVHVNLMPSDDAWKVGLHADGKVYSQTRSDTWPVKVRNSARYEYEAEKIITIDENGMDVSRATSTARGRNEFLGTDSRFDRIPILGALFSGIARKQNERSRPLAVRQVKGKVAYHARRRMDSEANPKLAKLEQKFRSQILVPFGQLALAAEPVDMFTTPQRAVLKLKLANMDQLAAHSPRPAAPSDSLVSMQLHETALNNALEALELEGQRLTLAELHQFIAQKFDWEDLTLPPDLPQRAVVHFASHDAIHVAFTQDHLELVLSVRELAHGRDKICNFKAHVFYRPVIDGLAVQLVRDETLQFSGPNLRTGPRFVLHSVLGKVFVQNERIPIVRDSIKADHRLTGLMVTQLVVDDGWLAVAIGPASPDRIAWRAATYDLENLQR